MGAGPVPEHVPERKQSPKRIPCREVSKTRVGLLFVLERVPVSVLTVFTARGAVHSSLRAFPEKGMLNPEKPRKSVLDKLFAAVRQVLFVMQLKTE